MIKFAVYYTYYMIKMLRFVNNVIKINEDTQLAYTCDNIISVAYRPSLLRSKRTMSDEV